MAKTKTMNRAALQRELAYMLFGDWNPRELLYANDVRGNIGYARRRRFWLPMLPALTYRTTPWVPR
jgi:hypothetical protein